MVGRAHQRTAVKESQLDAVPEAAVGECGDALRGEASTMHVQCKYIAAGSGQRRELLDRDGDARRDINGRALGDAENALVGAGQAGCRLHAAMTLNTVERVLVTSAPPTHHRLGPAAQLDARVGPNQTIALLGQCLGEQLATTMSTYDLLSMGPLVATPLPSSNLA